MVPKKCVEWGFGYEESEYAASFGPSSPSNPATPESFSSPFRDRNPERNVNSSPREVSGSIGQSLGSRAYILRDKRSVVKLIYRFFFASGEIYIFRLVIRSLLISMFQLGPFINCVMSDKEGG